MVSEPGQPLAIRGEFVTAESALARAQHDYDSGAR